MSGPYTLIVKDGSGNTQTINLTPPVGVATGANSLPVVVASDQAAIPVRDGNSASISTLTLVTPSDSTTLTAPKLGITIITTVAGNVALGFANSMVIIVPVVAGVTILPFSPTLVKTTGTTATATYYLNN